MQLLDIRLSCLMFQHFPARDSVTCTLRLASSRLCKGRSTQEDVDLIPWKVINLVCREDLLFPGKCR